MPPTFPDPLVHLITALVPASRKDPRLADDLLSECQDILRSHIGRAGDRSWPLIVDSVKRRLLQINPSGERAVRFGNLLTRLLEQPVISKKPNVILFLLTLSSSTAPSNTTLAPSIHIPFLDRPTATYKTQPPPLQPHPPAPESSSAAPTDGKGQSKAAVLRAYRGQTGTPQLPENLLLRDALYLMQGISGKYVLFVGSQDSDQRIEFTKETKDSISIPTQTLIHRLAELGYLYSRVESFVRERESAVGVGMIEQSLCHYLQIQLTEYYRLIALLETQMATPQDGSNGQTAGAAGLSLRRLDVWVNEWRLRMRMMSVCVEGAREKQGGALVNLIHSYTDNGDPFVRKFTDELLEEVSKPFFSTLHKWLFSGELYDPFGEFFVAVDSRLGHGLYVHPSALPGGIGPTPTDMSGINDLDTFMSSKEAAPKLWEAKYRFKPEMLPMFIGESFGKKIFSTGKSLNFIRYSCLDSDWVITREKMSNTSGTLQYGDIAGLERSIDSAYQVASHRLFDVFIDKFKLLQHLSALKAYLLLGYGDFSDHLMETLGPSLSRPASSLYRHTLTANIEGATRNTMARFDPPDVLRRLDARMLEYSHGEIGWDVFTLEYKVDPPIDTVLDGEAMDKYLKLFRHLWQMRRIKVSLDKAWMKITGGSRTFGRVPELDHDWHRIRLIVAEMIHFIRQLEAYYRLEVIECSWKELNEFLNKKEGDLDALIDAHRSYLDNMVKKILLWNSKPGREEVLLKQVLDLLSTVLHFREIMDAFYNYCLAESARRDHDLDQERGVHTAAYGSGDADSLPALRSRLKDCSDTFSDKMVAFVAQLSVHPDLDCRFLGIRLSFSDFYKPKRESKT